MKKTLLFIFALLGLGLGTGYSQCGPPHPATVNLGANTGGNSDWDWNRMFNDVFKLNRGFSTDSVAPWLGSPVTNVDSNGWPLQDFGVIVMTDMDSSMGGTYSIQFNGQATLTPIASGFTVQSQVYNMILNTSTANLVYPDTVATGGQMMLGFTNTLYAPGIKGVKNIQIMKPHIAFNGPTFDARFLNHFSRFSTIRYMDLLATNGTPDSLWSNRSLPSAPTQEVPNGVAWEYLIQLADTTNTDMWINIPVKANNDYVTQLATLIKNNLKPALHVYVEYSNEVWNSGFPQYNWNLAQATAQGSIPGNPLNYDNVNNDYTWAWRLTAQRGMQISNIFRSVFGNAAMNNTIRVVFATQESWFEPGETGIEFINNYYARPDSFFYALAVAPYFDCSAADTGNNATPAQLLSALQTSAESIFKDTTNPSFFQYNAIANYYNLKYVCYEAGSSTFGPNNIRAKIEANQSPQMKTICTQYLTNWYSNSGAGSLLNWFTGGAGDWNSPYGTWSLTQLWENSEKLQAVDSMLAATPPPLTSGFTLPGNIDARLYAGYPSTWNSTPTLQPSIWHGFDEYLLQVPKGEAGQYQITLKLGCQWTGQLLPTYLDNKLLDTVVVPNTGSDTVFQYSVTMTGDLLEGLHTLRFVWINNAYVIDSIEFKLINPCVPNITNINQWSVVSNQWSVYPNPSSGIFTIQSSVGSGQLAVVVYNVLGEEVYFNYQIIKSSNYQINLSAQPNGVYFYRVVAEDGSVIGEGKVVVQK